MKKYSLFKDRLKTAMLNKGYTQIELARISGISKSLINKYLKGVTEAGAEKLNILSKYLGVDSNWLLGLDIDELDVILEQEQIADEYLNGNLIIKSKKTNDSILSKSISINEIKNKLEKMDYDEFVFIIKLLDYDKDKLNKLSIIEKTMFDNK